MIGDEDRSFDEETRRQLDEEVERHQAALAKATDDFQVTVLCANYLRRIGEILRTTGKASD